MDPNTRSILHGSSYLESWRVHDRRAGDVHRQARRPLRSHLRLTQANRRIAVPACFIAGARDWGTWQAPGALDAMPDWASRIFPGVHLVDGTGHRVQQDQPAAVVDLAPDFIAG